LETAIASTELASLFQESLPFKKAFLSIKAFFAHRAVSQFLRCFYSHLVSNSPNFEENEPRNNARSKCLVTDWFSEESQVTRQTLADRKGMSATGKYKSILVVKNS